MVSSAAWACIVKLRSDDDAPQSDPLVSDGLKSISVGSCFAMRSSAITCEKESEVRSENDSEEEETYLYLETTMMPSAMMRSTVMDSDSLSTVDS